MIHPKQTLDEVFLMENPHQVGKLEKTHRSFE